MGFNSVFSTSRSSSLLSLWLVFTFLGFVLTAPVFAQSASERETARRLMDQGRSKEKNQDYPGASEAYGKAHAIMHVPTTALRYAESLKLQNKLVESRDIALEGARREITKTDPKVFTEAKEACRLLAADLARKIPSVTFQISGGHPSKVLLDETEMNKSALDAPFAVNPGHHVIEFFSELYSLHKDASTMHKVAFDAAEGESKTITISLPDSFREPGLPELSHKESSSSSARSALLWSGLGLAVLGAGTGTLTGIFALNDAKEANAACQGTVCLVSSKPVRERAETMATVSTISFVAAGVGVSAFVVALLLPSSSKTTHTEKTPPSSKEKENAILRNSITFHPYFTPSEAGLAGNF